MGDQEAKATIKVNFNDGTDYTYTVKDVILAKRYAHSIINTGFRIKRNGKLTYYPVHKIKDVEVDGEGIDQGPIVEKAK